MSTTSEATVPTSRPVQRSAPATVRRWIGRNRQSIGLLPVIVLMLIIGNQASDVFATQNNLTSVLQSSAVLGVLVVAESIILIAGRFDLSLESTVAFAPMLAAWMIADPSAAGKGWLPEALAVPIVLGAGALIGLINGVAVVRFKLNPFMMTLGMLIALRGFTYAMTDGATISNPPHSMVYIGQAQIFGQPIEIYLVIALFIVAAFVMRYHRFGRATYAIGGNEDAARAAGLRVDRTIVLAYVLGSVLAAIAGMILAGQVNAVTSQQGNGLIFTVFAASVIGGISLTGGRGALIGAGLGVLFLALITNVMTLAQVPSQVIDAARGLVIVAALFINRFTFESRNDR
jgi:simple sugar transport system permease protein